MAAPTCRTGPWTSCDRCACDCERLLSAKWGHGWGARIIKRAVDVRRVDASHFDGADSMQFMKDKENYFVVVVGDDDIQRSLLRAQQ